jgi:hypothetical protein
MHQKPKYLPYLYEIFYCFTGALGIFFLMETFKESLVLSYVNMNFVLLIWVFIVIMILGISNKQ